MVRTRIGGKYFGDQPEKLMSALVSSDRPDREVDYVVRLEFDPPLPEPFSHRAAWAKCDMLATCGL